MIRPIGSLVPLILAFLPTLSTGQQAQYRTFGVGCPGTGGRLGIIQNNGLGGPLDNIHSLGKVPVIAIEIANPPATAFSGFELYTKAQVPTTVGALFYRATAAGLPGAAHRGTITVGTSPGWYKAQFPTPFVIKPGETFFISWDIPNPYFAPFNYPVLLSGTLWKSLAQVPGQTTWTPFTLTNKWAFRINSLDALPTLMPSGRPRIGSNLQIDLVGGLPRTMGFLATGSSVTRWGGVTLPFDLTVQGAPGCYLMVSIATVQALPLSALGSARVHQTIPNRTSLLGFSFYHQWLLFDHRANSLGLVVSQGGHATVGL